MQYLMVARAIKVQGNELYSCYRCALHTDMHRCSQSDTRNANFARLAILVTFIPNAFSLRKRCSLSSYIVQELLIPP